MRLVSNAPNDDYAVDEDSDKVVHRFDDVDEDLVAACVVFVVCISMRMTTIDNMVAMRIIMYDLRMLIF